MGGIQGLVELQEQDAFFSETMKKNSGASYGKALKPCCIGLGFLVACKLGRGKGKGDSSFVAV